MRYQRFVSIQGWGFWSAASPDLPSLFNALLPSPGGLARVDTQGARICQHGKLPVPRASLPQRLSKAPMQPALGDMLGRMPGAYTAHARV